MIVPDEQIRLAREHLPRATAARCLTCEHNAAEQVWMGYERKRGKLEGLNHLLRGQDRREGASKPTFSQTLNRARYNPRTGRIHEGYGVLQPRVAIGLPATRRSWFVRLYARVATQHSDDAFAETCVQEAGRLTHRVEEHGWDGDGYLRGWFDGGEVLGSKDNEECQIDSLPKSWAVLSGAGAPDRVRVAMESVDARLVSRKDKVIRLFEPPFDKALPNPGYIRGCLPGVRENGGQHTHGALWVAMAFAQLGDWKWAWELTTLLNPLTHGSSPEGRERYRVEPYVMAADVYERLSLTPCVPPDWTGFTIRYRYRRTPYKIVARGAKAPSAGQAAPPAVPAAITRPAPASGGVKIQARLVAEGRATRLTLSPLRS